MPYVYLDVDELEGTEKVGSRQCVALLQHYAKLPLTAKWAEGKSVFRDLTLKKGTAVATFVGGKYQSLSTGNHAAFFISQDGAGMWIMDQWSNDVTKPNVSKRYIRPKGKFKNGAFIDASNNADAYSVID